MKTTCRRKKSTRREKRQNQKDTTHLQKRKQQKKRGIQVENMSNIYYEVDDDKRSPMDLLRSHGRAVAR